MGLVIWIECKIGKVCRKCCERGHMMSDCRKTKGCMNCKLKGPPFNHSVIEEYLSGTHEDIGANEVKK